jgi:competence protein ComEA
MSHLLRPVRALALALAVALVSAAAPGLAADGRGLTGVVNVNTASLEELQLLPGVGETRARAILAAREERGGFKSVDELVEVKGIGQASLARLRPFVRVEGKTTAKIE